MSDDRKDLPPVNSPNFLEKVREALSVYMGNRGDKLDRGVTLRDLTDSGLVTLRPSYTGGVGGKGLSPIGGTGPNAGGVYEADLSPPPTPSGFTATAAISNLLVACVAPTYTQGHGHAKSVLYGATWSAGALPVFSDAAVLTEFSGTVTSHATNPSTTWHLWLKWVTVDGVYSTSPAGGTNGVVTRTGEDVSLLLTALTGELTESQLFSSLGARINLIDGTSGLAGSVNARVLVEATARANAITAEATTRANAILAEAAARGTAINTANTLRADGDAQVAATVTTLTATVTANDTRLTTAVQTEATARADADSAEAAARTTIVSTLRTEIGQGDTATRNTAQAYVDTNFYTKTNRDSAVAAQNSTLRSEFATADANTLSSAQNYTYSQAAIDSANTTQTNTITSAYQAADTATLNSSQAYVQGYTYTKAQADSAAAGQVAVVAARLNSGGDTFVAVASAQTTANAKSANFVQGTAPTATKLDDLWIDTANNNVLKRWNGTAWVAADDTRIGSTASSLTTLSSQVNNASTGLPAAHAAVQTEATARATADSTNATAITTVQATVRRISLGLPLSQWALNGQSMVTVSDGKVGTEVLRLSGIPGAYPNQGNYIPIDPTKKYRARFWARPVAATTGLLYFTLQQFTNDSGATGPVNGGRSPYKPSGVSRASHNSTYGTDAWGEYSYVWDATDWQTGVNFFRPDFLDNYSGGAGYWDVQNFTLNEVTALEQNSAAIQTEASTRATQTGDLFAQYTVKVDLNGYVAGYGLASSSINGVPTSEFIIRADNFAIAPVNTDNAAADGSPFFYRAVATTIGGVSVPAGAYMKAAFIHDATITNAKIANLAVDNAKIADLSVSKLTAGSIAVGQFIESTSYVAGSAGWRINGNGTAELGAASIRGQLVAAQIAAGAITADKIAAGTITADKINGTNLAVVNGTFSGSLSAATGTFSGSIDVKSAASGARMEIKNNVIKVFDSTGQLRVQLGDLTV